jgi:hypothetical protein
MSKSIETRLRSLEAAAGLGLETTAEPVPLDWEQLRQLLSIETTVPEGLSAEERCLWLLAETAGLSLRNTW